jgi:hypothetical protein
MSELAFDKEGNPFRFSRRTKKAPSAALEEAAAVPAAAAGPPAHWRGRQGAGRGSACARSRRATPLRFRIVPASKKSFRILGHGAPPQVHYLVEARDRSGPGGDAMASGGVPLPNRCDRRAGAARGSVV